MEEKGLFTYFKECYTENYANFKGRARRKEYWGFILFLWIFMLIPAGLIAALALAAQSDEIMMLAIGYIGIFTLVSFIPNLAVLVRRLHDQGKSGWWYFISLIPYVGGIVLLIFLCKDGNPHENQYGIDPKGRSAIN